MIESIALTNFLSFKERTHFSFKPTKEKKRGTLESEDWWTEINGVKLLKTAIILGNNGSGKTNFLNFFSVINDLVTVYRESKSSARYNLPAVSYVLSNETKEKTSIIEVVFHTNGHRYCYYIEWNADHIFKETLSLQDIRKKEVILYIRKHDEDKDVVIIDYPSKSPIPIDVQELIKLNVLKSTSVISIYDNKNFECEEIRDVYDYFRFVDLWNVKGYDLAGLITKRTNELVLKPILLHILKDIGSTIIDYKVDTISYDISQGEKDYLLSRIPEEEFYKIHPDGKRIIRKIQFGYKVKEQEDIVWLPENLESEGTTEAIRLIIVLFDAIWRGIPIAIDECAQSIHPKTLEFIISFFLKSSDTAQVFMATQALYLLKWDDLRRDTIRFFSKNKETGCSLYNVINSKIEHKNTQIYDKYMDSTFGGEKYIMDKKPWSEDLVRLSECMKRKEWHSKNCL